MVSIDDIKRIVTAIEPNTAMLYWVDRDKRPDHYCVIVPHDRYSTRSDNGVEDKLCICSIHRFTKSKKDQVHEQIFDALVAEAANVADPVYDFLEANELDTGGFIHTIIDVMDARV